MNEILSTDNELQYITQLIGEENLPEHQQLILFIAQLIKNGFLIQSAFDDIDNFTDAKKLLGIIKLILLVYKEGEELLKQGFLIDDIKELDTINGVLRINHAIKNEDFYLIENLKKTLLNEIETLKLLQGAFQRK